MFVSISHCRYRRNKSVRARRLVIAAICLVACAWQTGCRSINPSIGRDQPETNILPEVVRPQQSNMMSAALPNEISRQQAFPIQQVGYDAPAALPSNAFTGGPAYGHSAACIGGNSCPSCPPQQPGGNLQGLPVRYPPGWRPDGIECPWPADEYLFDGGDREIGVEVQRDWTVFGLDQEDTVAHYDTLDGHTKVTPSNRVKIYAPRFASVRKVYGIKQHENRFAAVGVDKRTRLVQEEERSLATTVIQPVQPERFLVADAADIFQENTRGMGVSNTLPVAGLKNRFKLFEDFLAIRQGIFDNSEKARMNLWLDSAEAWTSNQAVQVTIDNIMAVEAANTVELQSVYKYEMPDGKPCLRIIKVASKKLAQPGDEVEFTLRFDNVGNQTIGNVTIIDNLTTRLEYVPDTAECDLKANFMTQENTGESLVLRWEIIDPLEVGKGGIIRFKCKVR